MLDQTKFETMKRLFLLMGFVASAILFYSCDSPRTTETATNNNEAMDNQAEERGITFTPITDTPDFPDAILEMNQPTDGSNVQPGNVRFSYNVKNYELGAQTEDAHERHLANSHQGKHIHLILNNEPYTAHYEPEFQRELQAGHYVALSFLSRSYHESLKHPSAYILRQFRIGNASSEPVDLNAPHMFYSRPKGDYEGEDTHKVMLDFYLVNTELSPNGNKVRATINGEEFMIDEWQPYAMEGLPMGETTIKLELLDQNNNVIPGPYNTVTRTITLKGGTEGQARN
jgi:hypothetical protein